LNQANSSDKVVAVQKTTILLFILRLALAAYFLFFAVSAACAAWLVQPENVWSRHIYAYRCLRLALIAVAVICALGAWSAWRERASMNFAQVGWPITASLISLLIGLGTPVMVYFWGDRSNFLQSNRAFAIPAMVGLLGLIVFGPRRTTKAVSAT
jgi:hypothetical protein